MAAEPSRMVGKYRLYEQIGSGGMGSVHLGRLFSSGGFRRIVAIKRLHPQFAADAEFVSAFLDEARLASRVHHPNVVAPLDVVATDGDVFLVFEHLLGVSLSVLGRRAAERGEPVPPRVLVSIMVDVLHGLHAAHEARGDDGADLGLIHRDVSPQNIMVGKDGSARLLDFGIAKAAGRSQTTNEGIVKGKRGYMAPEHLLGKTCRASDLYSASVVMWELLAGRRLFADEASLATRIAGDTVPAPFSFGGGEVWPDRAAMEAVVLRGLEHAPGARYTTAREMAIALEAFGVATAREVGEWVERVGHAELEERERMVGIAESSASEPILVEAQGGPATARTGSEERAAAPRARRRWPIVVALALLLGSLLVFAAFRLRSRSSGLAEGAAAAAASGAASRDVGSLPGAASLAIPAATSAAPPVAIAPEGPPADPKAIAAGAKAPPGPRTRPQAKRPPAHCPPYVIDASGHKVFNEECLR